MGVEGAPTRTAGVVVTRELQARKLRLLGVESVMGGEVEDAVVRQSAAGDQIDVGVEAEGGKTLLPGHERDDGRRLVGGEGQALERLRGVGLRVGRACE